MLFIQLFVLVFVFVFCERDQFVVVSDIHVGSYWFTNRNNTLGFPKFLSALSKDESVHTLVINGDFIDRWLISPFEIPEAPVDVLSSSDYKGIDVKSYIDLIKKIIASGIEVIFVTGNHDDQMKLEYYESVGLNISVVTEINMNNVHVEHGHLQELVCMPDPAGLLPIGYYAARAMAFSGGLLSQKWRKEPSYLICEALEDVGLLDLISDNEYFIEMMMSYSLGDKWGTPIVEKYKKMKHESFGLGCFFLDEYGHQNVTIEMVVKKYRSFIKRFIQKFGKDEVLQYFKTQCDDYRYFIEKSPVELFILGHTHIPLMRIYPKKGSKGNVVYANTGSWTDAAQFFPVVKVNKTKFGDASFVELTGFDVDNMSYFTVDSSPVPNTDNNRIIKKKNERYENEKRSKESNEQLTRFLDSIMAYKESKEEKEVPSGWKCDPHFYDSKDGCDCNCGVWDPDCGSSQQICHDYCMKMS